MIQSKLKISESLLQIFHSSFKSISNAFIMIVWKTQTHDQNECSIARVWLSLACEAESMRVYDDCDGSQSIRSQRSDIQAIIKI